MMSFFHVNFLFQFVSMMTWKEAQMIICHFSLLNRRQKTSMCLCFSSYNFHMFICILGWPLGWHSNIIFWWIFVPIHHKDNFFLVMVNHHRQCIDYLDPMPMPSGYNWTSKADDNMHRLFSEKGIDMSTRGVVTMPVKK